MIFAKLSGRALKARECLASYKDSVYNLRLGILIHGHELFSGMEIEQQLQLKINPGINIIVILVNNNLLNFLSLYACFKNHS